MPKTAIHVLANSSGDGDCSATLSLLITLYKSWGCLFLITAFTAHNGPTQPLSWSENLQSTLLTVQTGSTWSSFTTRPESFFHWLLGWKPLLPIFSHVPPVFILFCLAKTLKFEAVSKGEQGFSAILLASCAPVVLTSCCWVRFRYLPLLKMQFMFYRG